jgi:hypothetical protein
MLQPTPDPPDAPTTLYAAVAALPANSKWSIDHLDVQDNGQAFATAIIMGQATAISDGSYKDRVGTSASMLHGSSRSHVIASVNVVPGRPSEQSAYRSELSGIIGSLTTIRLVCQLHNIQSGSVTIGLDGYEAMRQSSGNWPLDPQQTDFDMLKAIRLLQPAISPSMSSGLRFAATRTTTSRSRISAF